MKSRGGKRRGGKRREEKRRDEETRSEKRKSRKKEDAGARKSRKVAKHCVFPMLWGSGGSQSRLAKAAGAEPSGEMRDEKLHAVVAWSTFRKSKCQKQHRFGPLLDVEMSKKCTALWHEAHFEVKSVKNWRVWITFGSWDVEKVRAIVARSTFRSQNAKNTAGPDHFWKLRCSYVVARSTFPSQNAQSAPALEHFWKLRCSKSAGRCGAKHISKWKC